MQVGDIGVTITINIQDEGLAVDLTTATAVNLIYQLGATVVTRVCTIANAVGGIVDYVTTSADFLIPGLYTLQVVVNFTGGSVFHSDEQKIAVGMPL